MPSSGNQDLIRRLEAVDRAFTALWTESLVLKYGTFFFNPEMPDDVFFNKLTDVACLDDKIIADLMLRFKKYSMPPYVYVLNRPDHEEILVKNNFRMYDVQHVLVRTQKSAIHASARMVSPPDSIKWSKIFCRAYDCEDWLMAVDKIVRKTSGQIDYFTDESMSSCVALHETAGILGLYCLGTVPELRKRGKAGELIGFSMQEATRRKLDFLMLETYQKDNLLDFYRKHGFETIYRKKIFVT